MIIQIGVIWYNNNNKNISNKNEHLIKLELYLIINNNNIIILI